MSEGIHALITHHSSPITHHSSCSSLIITRRSESVTLPTGTVKPATILHRSAVALLALAVGWWLLPRSIHPAPLSSAQVAAGIERFTWAYLAAPYPTGRCETASHLTYAREPGASIADHWYVSSQIMANVALARVTEGSTAHLNCAIERGFTYLEQLWQPLPPGGYAPRSDLDGRNPTTRDIYADDNAIAGIAMLEAADYLDAPDVRLRMRVGAIRAAAYLMDSGLWDDTFGGGFWWNSQRQHAEGGKPVQTAGLAISLFARLHGITGDQRYREWAELAMSWCDERLFDPTMGLYRYGFRDPQSDQGHHPTFVNYDQAIMIEAHLDMHAMGDVRLDHLGRAQTLGENLERFRSSLGGYEFELGIPQVFSHYSAWSSSGLLRLYEVDPRPSWITNARESLRNLNTVMLDPGDGGVYYGAYECIPQWAALCPQGAPSAVDERKVHLSQSWTQRAMALLARAELADSRATTTESRR
ncbi:MAG: glycoside hydrolase family 76 protein [Chloroflexota bacterium]